MGLRDPMLLTFPQPAKHDFDSRSPHEFVPYPTTLSNKDLPNLEYGRLSSSQPAGLSAKMTTPHRGLPPPAAMTLPDPSRIPPSIPVPSHSGSLPAPPMQWQGAEESMRNWLITKAEEEKRRQEEEKTRQESLRLEQRKIEQSMLQDSIRHGVPPSLVPMIFAGIGGTNLGGISVEWLQQYAGQVASSQQVHVSSPDARRNERLLGHQSPQSSYAVQPPQALQAGPAPAGQQPLPGQVQGAPATNTSYSPYGAVALSPPSRSVGAAAATGPTSAPRGQFQNVLPRLATSEGQAPPAQSIAAGKAQVQPHQQEESSSIYFHHWVPPGSTSAVSNPTPASPSDYASSPKKRKAQGSHQPAPLPSTAPRYTSPSYSHLSSTASTPARRSHARNRSDASSRKEKDAQGRPATSSSQAGSTETTEHVQHQRGGSDDPSESASLGSPKEPSSHSRRPEDRWRGSADPPTQG